MLNRVLKIGLIITILLAGPVAMPSVARATVWCTSETIGGSCIKTNQGCEAEPDTKQIDYYQGERVLCTSGAVCCIPKVSLVDCEEVRGVGDILNYPSCAFREISTLTGYVLEMAIGVTAIGALFFMILGGYYYLTARDKPEQEEKARGTIQWAIIGAVLAASAYIIVSLFGDIFNIQIFAQENVKEGKPRTFLIQISGEVSEQEEGEVMPGVEVSLFQKQDRNWQLWPAQKYEQRNPVLTDSYGLFTFKVPPGEYYLTAKEEGYFRHQSETFSIKQNSTRYDIQLRKAPKFWPYLLTGGGLLLVGTLGFVGVKAYRGWRSRQKERRQLLKEIKEGKKEKEPDKESFDELPNGKE